MLSTPSEAAKLRRNLSADRPDDPNLVNSFGGLLICMSILGHPEDTLDSIREVVELRRHLAVAVFKLELAKSLHGLSGCLSNLGHREDALDAIRAATELYWHLETHRSVVFESGPAKSLFSLSGYMFDLGHR